jgi:hypothetical protein
VALCLGTYGDPRGVGASYERGIPVGFDGWGIHLAADNGLFVLGARDCERSALDHILQEFPVRSGGGGG